MELPESENTRRKVVVQTVLSTVSGPLEETD
jgi:hypothetical protein